MYILIAVLLLILAIFGIAGMMDSYATAKQAQATIEVAQVAQVNAWGNLIVILLLALVILCVAGAIVWIVMRNQSSNRQRSVNGQRQQALHKAQPSVSIETMIQLKTLELLDRMSRPANETSSSNIVQDDVGASVEQDEFHWLRG